MKPLVIIGAGGHGRELLGIARAVNARNPTWDIMGFVADGEQHPERAAALGAKILGGVDLLERIDAAYLIGIGAPGPRAEIDVYASRHGLQAAILVHPTAVVGDEVTLEPGCVVAAGAVLTTQIHLGRHTHVNVGASVSHDAVLGRWCTVGPGARVAGWVQLGDAVDVGIGAVFRDRVKVGDRVVVGAGAVVVKDVPADLTVAGVPAKPLGRSAPHAASDRWNRGDG
ncbi:MAG: NeuD/PglB/VioB family sugar acetyltransferase [Egibacteraceae bacterium]